MNVSEFIEDTVSQVLDSVMNLNQKYSDKDASVARLGSYNYKGTWSDNYITEIDFDIALEVSNEKEKNHGARVNVASILNVAGDSVKNAKESATSRVRFSLPIKFPSK